MVQHKVMKKSKTIALCSSASFYRQVLSIEKELKKMGFKTKIPSTAYKMKKNNNFSVNDHKLWYKDSSFYRIKTKLIKNHIKKIIQSDAVLIVNLEKDGKKGYIGGNVLIEMAIAFHYKKPIFIFNKIEYDCPFLEEILAMKPVFINGSLEKIKL